MASSVFTAVIDEMTGATSSTPGLAGLVPAPAAGDEDKVLRGDGTWAEVEASGGTLRVVPFSIGANSWTLANGLYTATYSSAYVTATSVEFVEYTDSFRQAIRGDLSWVKATGYGGITFTTTVQPVGTLQGEIRVIDNDDGSVAIVTQQTALPTMRDVPFTVAVADWTLNNDGLYEAVFTTTYVTATSHDFVEFDESIENATDGIKATKAESSGSVVGLKLTSRRVPAGTISGTITPLDNADGKVAVVLQDTVMPIENGGTGANTLKGAQDALGITALNASLTTYFEAETAIGTWIDGKTIYQKVIAGKTATSGQTTIIDSTVTRGYIDSLISLAATFRNASDNNIFQTNYLWSSPDQRFVMSIDNTGIKFVASGFNAKDIITIVRYTKAS